MAAIRHSSLTGNLAFLILCDVQNKHTYFAYNIMLIIRWPYNTAALLQAKTSSTTNKVSFVPQPLTWSMYKRSRCSSRELECQCLRRAVLLCTTAIVDIYMPIISINITKSKFIGKVTNVAGVVLKLETNITIHGNLFRFFVKLSNWSKHNWKNKSPAIYRESAGVLTYRNIYDHLCYVVANIFACEYEGTSWLYYTWLSINYSLYAIIALRNTLSI